MASEETPRSDGDGVSDNLHGQWVVIVGGTSGMGRGAVRAAARAGASVIVAGRRREAERSVTTEPGHITHAQVDVTDEQSVRSLFEQIGAVDHLFVTATPPSSGSGRFLEQDVAAAQSFMTGKFFGSWACARYAAPTIRPGGSITFLIGCAAVRPPLGRTMVTATFAALEAFSQALALELGPIRVNTIRPGIIDSDMWSFLDDAAREELRRKTRAVSGPPDRHDR